ncbi:hypothetical protein WN944_023561 [Citrus x changshan-huyou]|uniref:Uncharacterized protein n=1 Tax=Citrus x changshan-huyou TaxID=2935761 RepID=A0AAP0N5Q8_9ROSI
MSAATSSRSGKHADYERAIDQLEQQVTQIDEKICQLKTAIGSVLKHLREVIDSPPRTLTSPSTDRGKSSRDKKHPADGSPKMSTPGKNSENSKKRPREKGSNDRLPKKKPRGDTSEAIQKLAYAGGKPACQACAKI